MLAFWPFLGLDEFRFLGGRDFRRGGLHEDLPRHWGVFWWGTASVSIVFSNGFGDRCHAEVVELRFGGLDGRDFRRDGLHEDLRRANDLLGWKYCRFV